MKLILFFIIIGLLGFKGKNMIGVEKTGMWYSNNPAQLKKQIHDFLNQTKIKAQDDIMALIAPHAGYVYSGDNAAHAYASIRGKKIDRVILIGPSHYYYLNNQIALPDSDTYQTVLGTLPIDKEVIDQLSQNKFFVKNNQPFLKEHSTDNQVPFLQEVLSNCKLIPMIMGQFNDETINEVSVILKKYLSKNTLIVISSDFTHYGEHFQFNPFKDDVSAKLKKLNEDSSIPIQKIDASGFSDHVKKTGDTICGHYPITLLLKLLPKNAKAHVLKYSTSSEKTKDYSSVVSYYSFSFSGTWPEEKNNTQPKDDHSMMTLNETEKKDLLKLSRTILETYIKDRKILGEKEAQITITDNMKKIAGGFVTLHIGKELRGCIGEILPSRSILEVVKRRTISAATEDPRFHPVKEKELKDIHIEISILTPPREIKSYEEFIVGKHGIILEKKGYSAVFLPQVAPEQGWDRETTLNYLSQKAGLSMNAWRENSKFSVFEAIVFSEK